MPTTDASSDPLHITAAGHALSGSAWLDAHFEESRVVYEAMVAATPFQPGWRILDAGSGPGGFLPALASRVGEGGSLTALDVDAENLGIAEERVATSPLPCPVTTRLGSVTDIPFGDASFDGVWCANVSQYLSDDDLLAALAEFRRVVRPGGVVAVKEADGMSWNFGPMDPCIWLRTVMAQLEQGNSQTHGVMRATALRRWLERAGLDNVWQQMFPEELWAPLTPAERRVTGDFLRFLASIPEVAALPESDREFWDKQLDPSHPDALVNHPDFYERGGYVLAVGIVPAR